MTTAIDSSLSAILAGDPGDVMVQRLIAFDYAPTAVSTGDGMQDDYDTETVPGSFDEVLDAQAAGVLSSDAVQSVRQGLYDRLQGA